MSSALLLQLAVAHVVKREDDKPLSLRLGILAAERGLDGLGGDIDDDIFERQILEVTCSACSERLQEREPLICCRCIKDTAVCNNDFGRCYVSSGQNHFLNMFPQLCIRRRRYLWRLSLQRMFFRVQ